MTVKQLKEELSQYPDNMDVFIDERVTEFNYGLLNSVRKKDINMTEGPGGEVMARETVIILSEE